MHFSSGGSALSGLSPGTRDTMDPIAELLSQLSSVRSRAAAAQSVSSQLQQLEMQLQSTRYGFGCWLALIYTKSFLFVVRFDLLVLLSFLVNFKIWHGMACYKLHKWSMPTTLVLKFSFQSMYFGGWLAWLWISICLCMGQFDWFSFKIHFILKRIF